MVLAFDDDTEIPTATSAIAGHVAIIAISRHPEPGSRSTAVWV